MASTFMSLQPVSIPFTHDMFSVVANPSLPEGCEAGGDIWNPESDGLSEHYYVFEDAVVNGG